MIALVFAVARRYVQQHATRRRGAQSLRSGHTDSDGVGGLLNMGILSLSDLFRSLIKTATCVSDSVMRRASSRTAAGTSSRRAYAVRFPIVCTHKTNFLLQRSGRRSRRRTRSSTASSTSRPHCVSSSSTSFSSLCSALVRFIASSAHIHSSSVTFGMTSTSMFYFTKVMQELFIESGEEGFTFNEMTTMDDFWKVVLTLSNSQ